MRIAFSLTVALIALMLCTTLVASEVSASGNFGVGNAPLNFFTMLHQLIMNFMHLWFFHVPTPLPTPPPPPV